MAHQNHQVREVFSCSVTNGFSGWVETYFNPPMTGRNNFWIQRSQRLNHHQHKSQAANLIVIVKPNFNLNTYLVSEWKADSVAGIWLCKCGKVASTKQNLGNHILQKHSIDLIILGVLKKTICVLMTLRERESTCTFELLQLELSSLLCGRCGRWRRHAESI